MATKKELREKAEARKAAAEKARMRRRGIYRTSDGRFLRRLWPAQPFPQAEVDAGNVVVKDIPPALVEADELSHTRWDGKKVMADRARAKETVKIKTAHRAAATRERDDASAAIDALHGGTSLSAAQASALKNRLGLE